MADPPGWKLRRRLQGHEDAVTRFAWSWDGSLIATPSFDGSVVIWDSASGRATRIIRHDAPVSSVTFSPDGTFVASCVDDRQDRVWELSAAAQVPDQPLDSDLDELMGHHEAFSWQPDETAEMPEGVSMPIRISEVATGLRPATLWSPRVRGWPVRIGWSPSGRLIATASDDGVAVWQARTGELLHLLTDAGTQVSDLCFRRDRDEITAVTLDGCVASWDALSGEPRARAEYDSAYRCVASSHKGVLACGADDGSIEIFRLDEPAPLRTLEGHPSVLLSVSFSYDGRLLASKGADGWVRLWDTSRWDVLTELREPVRQGQGLGLGSIAFSPASQSLATLGKRGLQVRLWELDPAAIAANRERPPTTHYANAKVVLVGDTSVGKTGLGLVLADEPFRATESTHRRQVWLLDREVNDDSGEPEIREVYLWDLAGQPGYRLLHQLHLRDIAVALVLFDAKGESEPFSGVRHWVRALRQAEAGHDAGFGIPRLLVAARLDRGGPAVSDERVQQELLDGGFAGFHKTSAKQGWGVPKLGEKLRELINWDEMPRVSSTGLFDSVKDFRGSVDDRR